MDFENDIELAADANSLLGKVSFFCIKCLKQKSEVKMIIMLFL